MIYPYQQTVVDAMRRISVVHQRSREMKLPIRPRTHSLLIGPTGTGKSFLVKQVFDSLNWATYHVNCSAWIVMGARGDHTLPHLIEWVAAQKPGRPMVVFLDEIDKVESGQDWFRSLRSELFSVLDGHIPAGSYSFEGDQTELRRRFKDLLVIGAGAFQHLQDGPKMGLGFNPDDKTSKGLNALSGSLARELTNRFSDKVLVLPELSRDDYMQVATKLHEALPPVARRILEEITDTAVVKAIDDKLGARFAESLMLEVFERLTLHAEPTPWVAPVEEEEVDDSLWDEVVSFG